MLLDSQIDRYSRQVILPEVGGAGQERLLASTVSIYGSGDGALLCASYLAGAGIGTLWLDAEALDGPAATVLGLAGSLRAALSRRSPDCTVLAAAPHAPSAVVVVATAPLPSPNPAPLFWGGAAGTDVACVRFPVGRACAPCLDAALGERHRESTAGLGALLALVVLRDLLGLESDAEPWFWRFDDARPKGTTTSPFPTRPGCACSPAIPRTGERTK